MRRYGSLALWGLSASACWYGFNHIYFRILWQYVMLLTSGLIENSMQVFVLAYAIGVVLPAIWCAYMICGLAFHRISFAMYLCGGIAYSVGLMICMVLKSWNNVTAWGINLDIAGFLDELMAGSITPVLNIVLLIPVGFFLASCRGARFAVIIGASGSILVESLEFVFHLGVLDVLDICTNVMGVLIGIGCLSAMRWMGFRRIDIDGGHFYLVRRHDSSDDMTEGQ